MRSSAPRLRYGLAALEDVGTSVAETDRGHQRHVEVELLLVQGAGGDDRVGQGVPQVWRRVGVHAGEVGQPLGVGTDLRHLRIQVGEDLVAVNDRLAEPISRPLDGLHCGGQRLVELDRIHLLRDGHHGLEQRVELGGHRRHPDHVCRADALQHRFVRRRECDVLVAEHLRGPDVRLDVRRIEVMYFGLTSSVTLAAGSPSASISSTSATLPITTPLYVTLDPESMTSPARGAIRVSCVFGANLPLNWKYSSVKAP